MAHQIEKNLSGDKNGAQITGSISSASSTSTTTNVAEHVELMKRIVKPKSRKGKSKEVLCKPLEDCKMKCKNKLTYEQQKSIFNKYRQYTSYNAKATFVSSLMEVRNKKRVNVKSVSVNQRNRTHSYVYSLIVDGRKQVVCQKCFRFTMGETESFLKTIGMKKASEKLVITDLRGKREPVNKLTAEKLEEIKAHINLFPAYESHYSRKRTSKKYLQSDLNLSKMFKMYAESHAKPVSITKYAEIFNGREYKIVLYIYLYN